MFAVPLFFLQEFDRRVYFFYVLINCGTLLFERIHLKQEVCGASYRYYSRRIALVTELCHRKSSHHTAISAHERTGVLVAVKVALYLYPTADKRRAGKVSSCGYGIVFSESNIDIAVLRLYGACKNSVLDGYIALCGKCSTGHHSRYGYGFSCRYRESFLHTALDDNIAKEVYIARLYIYIG